MEEYLKTEIPSEFYSLETGTYFDRCIECEKYLLEDETEYFIEKAVKKYAGFSAHDVIFEYAICAGCAQKMRNDMSKESMQSIQNYFIENIDVRERMNLVLEESENPVNWLKQCLIKKTPAEEVNEYQIYAHCNGTQLNLTQMPYMISAAALDEIMHLLSKETLDELGGFMDKHFGPPPELAEPLPTRRVILV